MRKNDNLTSPPRSRTSVAISGLDRSTPDDMVKDGACEELHNLRYKDAAWRPVNDFSSVQLSLGPIPYGKICYKHPATSEDKYIYVYYYAPTGKWDYYEISTSTENLRDATLIASFDERQKVSHFGNVLMFTSPNKTQSYLWDKKKYININYLKAPSLNISEVDETTPYNLPPDIFRVNMDITQDPANNVQNSPVKYYKDVWLSREKLQECLDHIKAYNQRATSAYKINPIVECAWLLSDADLRTPNITIHSGDYSFDGATTLLTPDMWYGEIMCFACYHLFDGSTSTPSPLQLIISNNTYDSRLKIKREEILKIAESSRYRNKEYVMMTIDWDTNYGVNTDISDINALSPITWHLPKLTIPDMRGLTSEIISSIAIYATRINPIFDSEHIGTGRAPITMSTVSHFSNNEMPSQPFYLVKEFPIRAEDDHTNGPFSINLTYDLLERSINNKIYIPSIGRTLSGNTHLDFNNRLHLANIRSTFNRDMILDNPFSETGGTAMPYRGSLSIKNATDSYVVTGSTGNGRSEFNSTYSRLLSVHDARAEKYIIENLDTKDRNIFMLQPALGNNIAYLYRSSSTTKFEMLRPSDGDRLENNVELLEDSDAICETNRIQASATNNPLTFPFENSYAIGSPTNTIIALQSAAIEMSDAKFGEFPLFAFTDEGIFALQAGSETLYASIIPINYDKIINPNTLAINGGIIYITERGVHLLAARGDKLTSEASTLISSPIHGKDGRPPLDFLRDCQIMWPKEHNEVIFHNPDNGNGIAYVFNLDAGYWSTRTLVGTKINTDEMVSENSIYDLTHEDTSKPLVGAIVTRPIKLGNVEFKRLETIAPRMSSGDETVMSHVHLTGSVNGTDYMTLREHEIELEPHKVNPFTLRRTPFSAKYFKYHMFMEPEMGETFNPSITHIDFEWYTKFQRRMR